MTQIRPFEEGENFSRKSGCVLQAIAGQHRHSVLTAEGAQKCQPQIYNTRTYVRSRQIVHSVVASNPIAWLAPCFRCSGGYFDLPRVCRAPDGKSEFRGAFSVRWHQCLRWARSLHPTLSVRYACSPDALRGQISRTKRTLELSRASAGPVGWRSYISTAALYGCRVIFRRSHALSSKKRRPAGPDRRWHGGAGAP